MSTFIKERDFGEIVQDTFSFFKDEIKPLIKILLVFVGPFALYGVYFMFKYQETIEQDILNVFQSKESYRIPTKYYTFILFSILQQIMLATTVTVYIKMKIQNKEEISTSTIGNNIYSYFFSVAYGQLLVVSIIMLGFFIAAITGLISFIFLALIAWSLYIIVTMYLLSFIIIYEEVSPIEAIKRSVKLIKGSWWFTFGAIITFGVIVGFVDLIFSTIIKSIIQIFSKGNGAAIIVLLFSSFISIILSATSTILAAFLYASFIAKKQTQNIYN